MRLATTMVSSTAILQNVLVGQSNNCFFPVFKGGRRKMKRKKRRWMRRRGRRRKEEDKEEEKEIRTQMQSFAAMQHSLLMGLGYRLLHFLVKNLEEEEEEEEEGIDEELAVLCFSRM